MANDKAFWSQFLEIYQSHPALWQSSKVDYPAESKEKGMRMLIEKMKEVYPEAGREMVLNKINIFRSSYKREVRKVNNSMRSGSSKEEIYKPKLWYFNQLKFLDDTDSNAIGMTSIVENSRTSGSSNEEMDGYFGQFKFLSDIQLTSIDNDMTFAKSPRKRDHDDNLLEDQLLAATSKLLKKEESEENSQQDENDYMFKWWYLKFKRIPFGVQRELAQKLFLDVAVCCSQGLIDIFQVKQIQDILYSNVSAPTISDNATDILGGKEEK